MNKFLKDFELTFIIKFLLLMTVFYYFHIFYWGVTLPGGLYIPFLEQNLNYIDWVTGSILHTSNALVNLIGLPSKIEDPNIIIIPGGASVIISFECLGLGVSSFWAAFVIPHAGNWKKKFYWIFLGVSVIWIINCLRISILLVSLEMRWNWIRHINHHDLFNIIAYVFIFTMIYFYTKSNKQELLKTVVA